MIQPNHGYLTLVLHAHLPFVRHPEHPVFLEESWLFEAITECYIPLLDQFEQLVEGGVRLRLAMSLTPTLCNMLADDLLRARYLRHLNGLIELSAKEMERHRLQPVFLRLAKMYHERFLRVRHLFAERYNQDLVGAFRRLQDEGHLEILACSATHALLPLVRNRRCLRAQLRVGVESYRRHFGRPPRGIWLPECAFVPGLDEELKAAGIVYFFLDSHGVLFGTPRPRFGTFAPVACRSRVAAFGRDTESGKQVWSAQTGYPGDPVYREFYRDLGHDAPADYIAPYLLVEDARHDVGIKYFAVSGQVPLAEKRPYDPDAAAARAAEHGGNFVFNRQAQARHLHDVLQRKPNIVSPYDAELFGHWWYEGPQFLGAVFRTLNLQNDVLPVTPSEYLAQHPTLQVIEPSASSWGDKGYFEPWLNGNNDWIYRLLHRSEEKMCQLVDRFGAANGTTGRAVNQAARELLLAQSSDWAFIMTTRTMASYAEKRVRDHVERFDKLYDMLTDSGVDEEILRDIEQRDTVFPEISAAQAYA